MEEAYPLSDLVAVETWTNLADKLSEELLWNLSDEIMHVHRAVRDEATRRMTRWFLEGRLKKRCHRKKAFVEVLPEYMSKRP